MNPIDLFGLGQKSKSSNITAQHRLNLYYDTQVDQDKVSTAAYMTPGTQLFATLSASRCRGIHWMESVNKLYVVQRNSLYEVLPNGTFTIRGTLSVSPLDDSNRVGMANNGTQLVLFTGLKAYCFNTSTLAFTTITLPFAGVAGAHVAFLDGYFITNRPSTGQFYISALYDGTSWLGTGLGDFATAESTPDNLITLAVDKGYLTLFGTSSTELWADSGSLLFPFARVNGAPSEVGIAAEWSLAKINGNLTALTKNRQGSLSVAFLDGYQWVNISGTDMDYLLSTYQSPSDAVAFGYTLNGRSFYQITFQTESITWLYDFKSQAWSQLQSFNDSRHLADFGTSFDNTFLVTNYANGSLYKLSQDYYTDNGQPIYRELIGKHVFAQSLQKVSIRRLRVEMEGGVGNLSGLGSNPTVMLQISRDNGHTWGSEIWTTIGGIGSYTSRAEWRRLGQARDWIFKIRVTDPVKVVIIRAVAEAQELNK